MIYFFFTKYFRAIEHTAYQIRGYIYIDGVWINSTIQVEPNTQKYYYVDQLPEEYQFAAMELLLTL